MVIFHPIKFKSFPTPIAVSSSWTIDCRWGPNFSPDTSDRGIVLNEPIGALAHLQLGRAYAIQSDGVKARAAYQDFLTLWKDADPDVPILREAKSEYAKLQ